MINFHASFQALIDCAHWETDRNTFLPFLTLLCWACFNPIVLGGVGGDLGVPAGAAPPGLHGEDLHQGVHTTRHQAHPQASLGLLRILNLFDEMEICRIGLREIFDNMQIYV